VLNALLSISRLARAGGALARSGALIHARDVPGAPAALRLAGAASRPLAAAAWSRRSPGERLAQALEGLGPAYIKLGQLLATRPDIVGADLARDLRALQDRLTPFSDAAARAAVARVIGKDVNAAFARFGPAVAAASIAQVHKARLASGEDVAVKILRPGVRRSCAKDMRAFYFAARWVERLFPEARRMEPVKLVETLEASLRLELDLRMEAAGASELADASSDDARFRTPAVYWDYTGADVLVLEWIDGARIDDLERLDAEGVDRPRLADTVMQTFLNQALNYGVFHADMHQGNLFVDGAGRLTAVDFGILGRLDRPTRRYLAEILFGFLNRDYERVAEVHFEAGYVPRRHSVAAFAQALRAVGEPLFGRDAEGISMSRVLMQLFEVTDLFDMRLRPELVLLQKTMVAVEGVCRQLDPSHNMWEAARPIVEDWMTENLGPPAQLRAVGDNALTVGRALQSLPELIRKAELAAEHIGEDGVRLDAGSLNALAQAQSKGATATRRALWAAAIAMIAAAVAQIF